MYAGVLGPCSQLKCQKLLRDIKIIDSNINLRLYEHFTLRYLKHFCRQRPNAKIFYLHTKGASKPDRISEASWRQYMNYFIIEQWPKCLELLKTYDMCGVNWTYEENDVAKKEFLNIWYPNRREHMFAGNFWWTNAHFINRLPDNSFEYKWLPDGSEHPNQRADAENFIDNYWKTLKRFYTPKIANMHTSTVNLWFNPYPRYMYDTTHIAYNILKHIYQYTDSNKGIIINASTKLVQECKKQRPLSIKTKNISIAMNGFDDEYFDWICVNEVYNFKEFSALYHKLKEDGLLCGGNTSTNISALQEFVQKINAKTIFTGDGYWMMRKPTT